MARIEFESRPGHCKPSRLQRILPQKCACAPSVPLRHSKSLWNYPPWLVSRLIETNPDAFPIADQHDREPPEGHVRGPLHGIPIALKDNIDTAEQMFTAAGLR